MPLYKSPNVYYLGDPVDTAMGRGVIERFDGDTVWVRIQANRRHPSFTLPMFFSSLWRVASAW